MQHKFDDVDIVDVLTRGKAISLIIGEDVDCIYLSIDDVKALAIYFKLITEENNDG